MINGKKPDQSLVADPYNEWFRLAIDFQSDKIRLDLAGLGYSVPFRIMGHVE